MRREAWRGAAFAVVLGSTFACGGSDRDDNDGGEVGITTPQETDEVGEGNTNPSEPFLDVGNGMTMGNGGDCPGETGGGDEFDFSYIWIANSTEGTVSKVNTFTAVEEGRYRTGDSDPDPSRTSVNQFGDVAVANRNGGIVKIAAELERCVDNNGDGAIQTSSGPNDILPFLEDECLLWTQDLPASGSDGPRPIAWEAVDSECASGNPRVWVGWYKGNGEDVGVFRRLDGKTGETLDEVEVPVWNLGDKPTGPYGGAVNAAGDFWVTGYYGPAIRIDAETLDVEWFDPPAGSGFYGMALDVDENVWIGGCDGAIYHYDLASGSFVTIATIEGRARGVQVDNEGRAWFAGNSPCRLLMADTETEQLVEDNIPLPGCTEPVGISIDVEGYVWVVDKDSNEAYKVDPDTHQVVATVTGLVDPYTYSDMTGHGLGLVVGTPQG